MTTHTSKHALMDLRLYLETPWPDPGGQLHKPSRTDMLLFFKFYNPGERGGGLLLLGVPCSRCMLPLQALAGGASLLRCALSTAPKQQQPLLLALPPCNFRGARGPPLCAQARIVSRSYSPPP